MQDTALYEYLLGITTPWTVSRVKWDMRAQRVDVWVEHGSRLPLALSGMFASLDTLGSH